MLLTEKQYVVRFCVLVYIHNTVCNVCNLFFFTYRLNDGNLYAHMSPARNPCLYPGSGSMLGKQAEKADHSIFTTGRI